MLRRFILALGIMLATVALLAGPVSAQQDSDTYPDDNPPTDVESDEEVLGDEETPDDTEVAGEQVNRLPVTGGDLVGLTVVGLGAVVVGVGLVGYRRRALR